jgi:2',3'-cyclic-nucleotide 2'-phosphodiesterase (5'-nucleotidase family)
MISALLLAASLAAAAPVKILYTSNTRGEIGTCGCGTRQLGGLARRATLIGEERNRSEPTLLLDAGDTFYASDLIPKHLEKESRAKAAKIAAVYRKLGYDGVLAGEIDALLPPADRAGIPFLESGALRTFERGGWRIAVGAYRSPAFDAKATADPAKSLADALAKAPADLVVLLFHGSADERVRVLAFLPRVDVVIAGHTGELLKDPVRAGKALVFEADNRGQYLGRLRIQKRAQPLSSVNQADRFAAQAELEFLTGESAPRPAEATVTPERAGELRELEAEAAAIREELQKMGKLPASWYAHDVIPILSGVRPDREIEELLR